MDTIDDVKNQVSQFIQQEILYEENGHIENSLLIDEGILDSFGILKMASFLENKFKIKLSPLDLTIDNFATIDAIAKQTWKKMSC